MIQHLKWVIVMYHPDTISSKIDNLSKWHIPIVVDREAAITNSLTSVILNIKIMYCWNNLWVISGGG